MRSKTVAIEKVIGLEHVNTLSCEMNQPVSVNLSSDLRRLFLDTKIGRLKVRSDLQANRMWPTEPILDVLADNKSSTCTNVHFARANLREH